MKQTFYELVSYLKNPVLENDLNQDNSYRFKKFGDLLVISILTSFLLMPLLFLIEHLGLVGMNDHAMEKLMKSMPKYAIFIIVVLVAPLLEELFFRAPLTLFNEKKVFKVMFFIFTFLFGLVHITNFTLTKDVLLLAPILVLPQTILGGYLGFIRIRFGLLWSMLLHGCYNAFFLSISFLGNI